jgi:hypothetical protein
MRTSLVSRNPGRPRVIPKLVAMDDRSVPAVTSAVQHGGLLSNSATRSTGHTVTVVDDNVGNVQVTLNGGASQFFQGINQLVLNVKGQNDTVNYTCVQQLGSPLLLGPLAIQGTEEITANLDGTNSVFNFNGPGVQAGAGLNVDVEAKSLGRHNLTLKEGPVGAGGFLLMEAVGEGASNKINENLTGDLGAGASVSLLEDGQGTLIATASANVGPNASLNLELAGTGSNSHLVTFYAGQIGAGASVQITGEGVGATNISSSVTVEPGSQGNVTDTETGENIGRPGTDTFDLEATAFTTTGNTKFSVFAERSDVTG